MLEPLGLTGLVAAPHTPFTAVGEVNFGVIEQQATLLVERDVSAAFVCGTTGEGPSLTGDERRKVVERWVKVAPKALPVIVHVGHTSVAESRELAAHAQRAGAHAVSALSPMFFKPRGVAELVDCCAAIASGAPALPFYYYHLPSMTGVAHSVVEFIKLATDRIPMFAGIKYTHNDLMEFRQCVRLGEERGLDVLFGRDEILLSGVMAGAKGAVGSTYNYAAPVYHKLIKAYQAGALGLARECQDNAVRLVEVIVRHGEIPAAKAILGMMGVDCGPARPPLVNLDGAKKREIYEALKDLPIFSRPLKSPGV